MILIRLFLSIMIRRLLNEGAQAAGTKPTDCLGRRLAALLVDWVPVLLITVVVQRVLFGEPNASALSGTFATLLTPAVFAVVIGYFTVMEGYFGLTLGKYLIGVRVLDAETGEPPGPQAAFVRSAFRTVDGLGGYLVGLIAALFSDDRQRIGDRVAGTVAVSHESPLLGLLGGSPGGVAPAAAGGSGLAGYTTDLTAQAAKGKYGPVIGREKEVRQIVATLGRSGKNNPVLVGEAGVGKTAVVEGLARKAAGLDGETPEAIKDKRLLELDLMALESGTVYRGMFEERLESVINEAQRRKDVILFADEVHRLMSLGSHTEDASPGAQMLKPALARGEMKMIGATTADEYRRIEKDPAMERRLAPIKVLPLTVEETTEVLERVRGRFETGGVAVADEALQSAAGWAERYLPGNLPDKAISLVDDAAAEKRADGGGHVAAGDLSTVIEDKTGVKVQSSGSDLARLKGLAGELKQRVVGQDPAAKIVAKTIQRRAALGDDKPASLLFLGPTGVGKTELAKALAESLFGSETDMIRLDMSEFQNENMSTRLTGAARGYKESEEGGQLTEAVRHKPYSVVLLDEIEKAHKNVLTLLLQLLDEGRLTDGRGIEVDFRNTIIIMTSNVGARRILDGETSPEAVTEELILEGFLPELLGRMDERVVFTPLSGGDLETIAGLLAKKPVERARERHGIDLLVDQSLIAHIAWTGKDPQFGARDLQKLVRTHVEEYLVEKIMDGEIGGENGAKQVELYYDFGEDKQYWHSPEVNGEHGPGRGPRPEPEGR